MRKGRLNGFTMAARVCATLVTGFFLFTCVQRSGRAEKRAAGKVPVIYCSDLFHPPDDPDDWFDLATAFSIDALDIRGIVLDQGEKQMQRTGRNPIAAMIAITGKKVPSVYGLPKKLKSPSDKGLDQPQTFQEGVKLILGILRKSDRKVTLIAVGSLRDVCAAFNRAPQLFKGKVERLYVVAGHSDGGNEYNVKLDPHAYVGVMRSGLPIYWLPCFGREPFVSKWAFKQGELLESWALEVQNYFAYGLMKVDYTKVDAVLALYKPIPEEVKKKVWAMGRSMWSTASFIDASGRTVILADGRWRVIPRRDAKKRNPVFRFVRAKVTISDKGITRFEDIDLESSQPNMHIFRFEGTHNEYNKAMKQSLEGLLKNLGR